MNAGAEADFDALSATISSVYGLRGIGVSAAYVSRGMWEWMQEQHRAEVEFHTTKTGALAATMKPFGVGRSIPVKVKYSGSNPWKIVVGCR